ncbi:MAG: hypothetical protein ACLU3G_07910 [Christensenellales bacterium]
MSELSKLLTFMFKEDRSEIIQQYNEMLDNAEDEQAMLESFGSPTRLAVAISRSYQRDERKLSVHADSKDGGSGENVKVKPVIPTQGKKSSAPIVKPNEPAADAYVDIIEEIRREKAAEEGIEYKPIFFKEDPKPEPAAEPEVEESAEEAAEETAQPVDEVSENAAEEAGTADEENAENDIEASDSEAQAEDADADTAEVTEGEAEDAPQVQADEGGEAEAEAPAEAAEPVDETAHVLATVFNETPEAAPEKVRKTNVFALILYIIVSIPVGLVLLLVMLGLELGVLGCGLLGLRVGFGLLSFTFSGMSVLADVLICFGVNIAVLALGVLVTWFAVWLIIVSVPWLIRGIKNLGRKLCVKEVEIDG